MANRISALAVDCTDPRRLADFWCAVLGYEISEVDDEGDISIAGDGPPFRIDFLRVPDGAKGAKNRLHLDLNATDRDQAAELARLLDLGAVSVDIGQGDVSWHVLADPEGNEFCLLRSQVAPFAGTAAG
ncbi:hypothetical protein SAMN05892883_0695 [Jatrophihabitans sp. GAS493]|uniref:VOC family protein n=1 Tax=Jatrophihabitans sp. GAS493 TaxID=1907575 RepID=UPI000BB720D6|nr:VOC family protein [Jatrophihabitans sp. GAS493]SOD71107.1 hypothetical protein SAMN05892883_0695 [Jatrophihabitans sp. GAS493]